MSDIKWTLTPEDVEWTMEAHTTSGKIFPEEQVFERDIIFLNDFWYEKSWPDEAKCCINVFVNMNDVFAPASDAERLHFDQIEPLYRLWKADPDYGPIAWCCKIRKRLPWREGTRQRMRDRGYDLEALIK